MTATRQIRRPGAFRPDDPDVVRASLEPVESVAGEMMPIAAENGRPGTPAQSQPRGFSWGWIFWLALIGLGLMALGHSITALLTDLFNLNPVLGWIGALLAALAALALLVIGTREAMGLARLSTVEDVRARATATLATDDRLEGRAAVDELLGLLRRSPQLARARASMKLHMSEIIDGADLIRLAERELMSPLDQEARRMVSNAAQRVSLVTAVSPRAAVDVLFVLATSVRLIRRLAYLYGGRPGTLGLLRLARMVFTHLVATGGVALGEGILQQVFGHGLVAKLSTRLGEGVLNGLLTARVGLAAMQLTRPLPFAALPQPALRDLAAELIRRSEAEA